MTIGESIQYYRKLAGLTQNQLCEMINTKQYNLAKYERGTLGVPNEIIPQIANALGVTTDYLFGEKPKELPKQAPKKSSRQGKLLEAFTKLTETQQRSIVQQVEALASR